MRPMLVALCWILYVRGATATYVPAIPIHATEVVGRGAVAGEQDGLSARNRAFLNAVEAADRVEIARFFPRRGDWAWHETAIGAPPGQDVVVRRFSSAETLGVISAGGVACESFWMSGGGVGPIETTFRERMLAVGKRWRRVAGNRFVPPGRPGESETFVEWRREDGRWVISAYGDASYWFPPVLGKLMLGDVIPDTTLALPPIPVYAAGAPWYQNHEPISFRGYRYVKYGRPRELADSLLTRIGRFGLVAVYTARDDAEGEVLYVPETRGRYQPYEPPHGLGPHCH
jgi:hypothetical protein